MNLPLGPMVYRATGDTIAAPALGLTVYLDDAHFWGERGALLALEALLAHAPADRLRYFHTSLMTHWAPVGASGLAPLIENLRSQWLWLNGRVRHQFYFRLADDIEVPSLGFRYVEIDSRRSARSGLLELTLPAEGDPNELLQLALQIANLGPMHCAVGGYAARWNIRYRAQAFQVIYRWCKRFLGLDVQDADELAHCTPRALPGSNWLTLVGAGLADHLALDPARLAATPWTQPVAVIPGRTATLIRAGEAPTLGDCNALTDYPEAYAEVARALAPGFIEAPPEFWGAFLKHRETRAWMYRLVAPEPWAP